MKSLSILGSPIWVMAFAALNPAALAEPKSNRQAQAESMGYQCRAAVRAEMEMKGPDCRMAIPPNPASHCNIPSNAEVERMDVKVLECAKRGATIKNRIVITLSPILRSAS